MTFLLDTNIILRSADTSHKLHREAVDTVAVLGQRGHAVFLVPQNFYEFWTVATRPVENNGLGMTPAEAAAELVGWQFRFITLPDGPTILAEWQLLVVRHAVRGKPAHDARLVAAMQVHGVKHLLTYNAKDFLRYPTVSPLTPGDVLKSPP